MYKVTSTTYNTTVTDRTLTEGDRKMCIRDQSFQKIVDHVHVFMPCMDLTELSPLQKLQFLIGDTCYYLNQERGDFFDRIGPSPLLLCCTIGPLQVDADVSVLRQSKDVWRVNCFHGDGF